MITENYAEHKSQDNYSEYSDPADWRGEVYSALIDSGFSQEAEDFYNCANETPSSFWSVRDKIPPGSNITQVYACDTCGDVKVFRATCHLRICPACASRAAARFVARYAPMFSKLVHEHKPRFRFRKIVLTTPYSLLAPDAPARLKYLKQAIPRMFDKLLPDGWRQKQGLLVSDEFGPDGLKLHFHIIFYGQYLSNKMSEDFPLASAWKSVTDNECEIVHISQVKPENIESELAESLKYCTKFWKTDPATGEVVRISPDLVPLLLSVLSGTRRVRSYGIFYNIPEPDPRPVMCPACICEMHRFSVDQWNLGITLNLEVDELLLYLRLGNNSARPPPVTSNPDPPPDLPDPPKQQTLPGMTSTEANHYAYN